MSSIRLSAVRISALVLCCFLWQALSGQVGAHPWHFSELSDSTGHHLHLSLGDSGLAESRFQADSQVPESDELCLDCHCHSGQVPLFWLPRVSAVSASFGHSHYRLWYYPPQSALHLRPPIFLS
ncbi:hypothetical protein [Alkalimonas mucilaginosa]|uniref:DUF2946 domain-containing protein n=1 Tax=Alkalimonas mucilaginosa TaxID=3057676 RepID=A0ABU7JHT3_9GAMM|nr:hypothetical protein [Alkalimonas sp. MEB004]MEE2025215.1 hypothetical protein [Alkalimonas sp. MEB004]